MVRCAKLVFNYPTRARQINQFGTEFDYAALYDIIVPAVNSVTQFNQRVQIALLCGTVHEDRFYTNLVSLHTMLSALKLIGENADECYANASS